MDFKMAFLGGGIFLIIYHDNMIVTNYLILMSTLLIQMFS